MLHRELQVAGSKFVQLRKQKFARFFYRAVFVVLIAKVFQNDLKSGRQQFYIDCDKNYFFDKCFGKKNQI